MGRTATLCSARGMPNSSQVDDGLYKLFCLDVVLVLAVIGGARESASAMYSNFPGGWLIV